MIGKVGLVFGVVSIIGFFTGAGVGFMIFWYQFRVRMLNLFISNYEFIEFLEENIFGDDESDEEDTTEKSEDRSE